MSCENNPNNPKSSEPPPSLGAVGDAVNPLPNPKPPGETGWVGEDRGGVKTKRNRSNHANQIMERDPNTGLLLRRKPRTEQEQINEFWASVTKPDGEDGCWVWSGAVKECEKYRDYGSFIFNGKRLLSHRLAYQLSTGKDAGKKTVYQSCGNSLCINPKHLLLRDKRFEPRTREKCVSDFWNKVDKSAGDDGCWIWKGAKLTTKDKVVYGCAHFLGKNTAAQRVAYIICKGEIPKNHSVVQSCDNKLCMNPKHLMLRAGFNKKLSNPTMVDGVPCKKCFRCQTLKPMDCFYTSKYSSFGVAGQCKECQSKHKSKLSPESKIRRREYHKQKHENDPAYRDRMKKNGEAWRKRPEFKEWSKNNAANFLKNPKNRASSRIRARVKMFLKSGGKNASTMDILGCSFESFKCHLESMFVGGMNWEKFSGGEIHIDHRIPVAFFNATNDMDALVCFNYRNHQPLWECENLTKHHHILGDDLTVFFPKLARDVLSDKYPPEVIEDYIVAKQRNWLDTK